MLLAWLNVATVSRVDILGLNGHPFTLRASIQQGNRRGINLRKTYLAHGASGKVTASKAAAACWTVVAALMSVSACWTVALRAVR